MFADPARKARLPDSRTGRTVVGVVSVLYSVSLVGFTLLGPFLLSALLEVPLDVAVLKVLAIAGGAYVVGMALLLR